MAKQPSSWLDMKKQGNQVMTKQPAAPVYLVSACLVGLNTRYDGELQLSPECRMRLAGALWIPVCPEQLGGLATPRPAAMLVGGDGRDVLAGRGRVVNKEGEEVTDAFVRGARQVLQIASSLPITGALLKAKSPSCGRSPNIGVTWALLEAHGFCCEEF